jgi:hypothetical protein
MFRFTIRDVLWLTVVVGLALGWGLDHRASGIRERDIRRQWVLSSMGEQLYKQQLEELKAGR